MTGTSWYWQQWSVDPISARLGQWTFYPEGWDENEHLVAQLKGWATLPGTEQPPGAGEAGTLARCPRCQAPVAAAQRRAHERAEHPEGAPSEETVAALDQRRRDTR